MPALDLKDEMRGGDTQPEESQPLAQPIAPSSIQLELSEEMQTMLVEVVMDDYHKAKSDREKRDYGITSKGETLRFTEWFKRIKDLYNGNRIPKTIPWRFCSNRSLRIATAILDLLHARLFPSVYNEDLTRWRPGKTMDAPKAERITKLMDWWIRVHAPLRPFFDKWTKNTTGFGDSLTESTWEVDEIATNETIDTPITDVEGQPLTNQDGTPAIHKQVKIDRVEKTKSRIISKENVYFMENAKDEQKDPVVIEETYLYRDLEDMERRGISINVTDKLKDFIHVAEPQGSISPQERERLRQIKLRNQPVKVLREYLHYDVDGVGFNESVRIMVSADHRVYLGGVRMKDVTKSGMRPISFDKFDNYLDRPDDLDGEGVLHKVRELAEEIDACFNQLTDAHTIAVLRPFFYDPSGDIDAPSMNLGPNKGIPVTDPQRNVYFPPIEIPTERLINAIRLVQEFIERLTAASEYIMGRESEIVGGSGTATRTQAIVQSAEVRFTMPAERLRFGAGKILSQHLDLIQLNIPQGLEQKILGEKGEQLFQAGELTDEGIAGKFTAYLLPDPSMGSKKTERELVNMMYSVLMQNPIIMSDPVKIYTLTAELLKVNGQDPEKYLGPIPSLDNIDDPLDENTLMIQGDFKRVQPQMTENHLYHVKTHMDLEKSPAFQELFGRAPELAQEILQYNRLHIEQHMQMMQQMMQLMQKAGSAGGKGGTQSNVSNNGTDQVAQGNGTGGSMETVPGPLGSALSTQRQGKVGGSSNTVVQPG